MCIARPRASSASYLAIADVGRNLSKLGQARPRLWVTPEPRIADLPEKEHAAIEAARKARSQVPKLPRVSTHNTVQWLIEYEGLELADYPDVEAVYYGPREACFGLVTKVARGKAQVWSITPPGTGDGEPNWMQEAQLRARLVATLELPGKRRDRMITAASFDERTRRLCLTSYKRLILCSAPPLAARPRSAKSGDPRRVIALEVQHNGKLPNFDQIEALTILDAQNALVASEGKAARFARVPLPAPPSRSGDAPTKASNGPSSKPKKRAAARPGKD